MGSISHTGQWIRNRHAGWYSGAEGAISIVGGNSVYFSCTSGKIFQKHLQSFDSFNQATGDTVFVVNNFANKYTPTNNLANQLTDAAGNSMAGERYNIVVWGVNNKDGQPDQIMVNLPIGSYGKDSDAIIDKSSFDVYGIPSAFRGLGFLIARYTMRENNGTFTLINTSDLRGQLPSSAGGGISGGGVTEFTSLADTPASYLGNTGDVLVVNSAETGLEFVNGASGSFTTNDGKTITITNGLLTTIA
jgi:hypothetical protein